MATTMASAASNAAAHHINHMALPAIPRIRPPRLLKGDPHPNNEVQPAGKAPPKRYWVQGKWRNPASNAAKHHHEVQKRQAARVLRQRTHGLDIYAYRHINTNQVVYSLSRTLESTQILKQLVYHGKKTVPANIRPDLWTPYFSVHFPPNPAGVYAGLASYQRLRDLSTQRQLSPPKSLITATEEDAAEVKKRIGSPADLWELEELAELDNAKAKAELKKIPRVGFTLPKHLRAKKLMDQKATSVADVAFVLDWISSGPSPVERMLAVRNERLFRYKERTSRSRRRINAIAREGQAIEEKVEGKAEMALAESDHYDRTKIPLDSRTLKQLSQEHHGYIAGNHIEQIENDEVLAEAKRQWEALNSVDFWAVNLTDHKERMAVAKAAESAALRIWNLESQAGLQTESSPWALVNEKRTEALQKFDEAAKERQRNAALKHAEQQAANEFRRLESSKDSAGKTTLAELISRKQEEALKQLAQKQQKQEEAKQAEKLQLDWTETWDIKMYWSDLNDGLFAKQWPQNVVHGSLAPFAVARSKPDENGRSLILGKNPHMIGGGIEDGWVPPEMLNGVTQPKPKPLFESPEEEAVTNFEPVELTESRRIEQAPPQAEGFLDWAKGLFGRWR